MAIFDHSLDHQEQGGSTIVGCLRPMYGVVVTAGYRSLERRGLEARVKWLEELQRRMGSAERDQVGRDRGMSEYRHIWAPTPGYLGTSNGAVVGRLREFVVHMALAIDAYLSCATLISGTARNNRLAGAGLLRYGEEFKHTEVEGISSVVTDNVIEFEGKPSHVFDEICRNLGGEQRCTRSRCARNDRNAERFRLRRDLSSQGLPFSRRASTRPRTRESSTTTGYALAGGGTVGSPSV